jgi:hypothetical protein
MRVDKEQLKALASKSDEELWREIQKMGSSHGYSLPSNMPSHENVEKIRRAMLGIDKFNMNDALKLMNSYKKKK